MTRKLENPRPRAWTDERLAELKRLLLEGCTYPVIAAALGVTVNAAIGAAHRYNVALGKGTGHARGVPRPRNRPPVIKAKSAPRQPRTSKPKPRSRSGCPSRRTPTTSRPPPPRSGPRMAGRRPTGWGGSMPSEDRMRRMKEAARAERPETERLIAEAIAAGKLRRLPPGEAWGSRLSAVSDLKQAGVA